MGVLMRRTASSCRPCEARTKFDWVNQDWTLSNNELAHQLGTSVALVQRRRDQFSPGPSPPSPKQRRRPLHVIFPPETKDMLDQLRDSDMETRPAAANRILAQACLEMLRKLITGDGM